MQFIACAFSFHPHCDRPLQCQLQGIFVNLVDKDVIVQVRMLCNERVDELCQPRCKAVGGIGHGIPLRPHQEGTVGWHPVACGRTKQQKAQAAEDVKCSHSAKFRRLYVNNKAFRESFLGRQLYTT